MRLFDCVEASHLTLIPVAMVTQWDGGWDGVCLCARAQKKTSILY